MSTVTDEQVRLVRSLGDLEYVKIGEEIEIPTITGQNERGTFYGWRDNLIEFLIWEGGPIIVSREGDHSIAVTRLIPGEDGGFPRRRLLEGASHKIGSESENYLKYDGFLRGYGK